MLKHPALTDTAGAWSLPADPIRALALPVKGRRPHGEGISDPGWRPLWEQILPLPP